MLMHVHMNLKMLKWLVSETAKLEKCTNFGFLLHVEDTFPVVHFVLSQKNTIFSYFSSVLSVTIAAPW